MEDIFILRSILSSNIRIIKDAVEIAHSLNGSTILLIFRSSLFLKRKTPTTKGFSKKNPISYLYLSKQPIFLPNLSLHSFFFKNHNSIDSLKPFPTIQNVKKKEREKKEHNQTFPQQKFLKQSPLSFLIPDLHRSL